MIETKFELNPEEYAELLIGNFQENKNDKCSNT